MTYSRRKRRRARDQSFFHQLTGTILTIMMSCYVRQSLMVVVFSLVLSLVVIYVMFATFDILAVKPQHPKVNIRDILLVPNRMNLSEMRQKKAIPECGEVCSHDQGTVSAGKYFPVWRKQVNCYNLLARIALTESKTISPAPKFPKHLLKEYTQQGEIKLELEMILDETKNTVREIKWTKNQIQELLSKDKRREHINYYTDGDKVGDLLTNFSNVITNKAGLVIGTLKPWLEAMLLNRGAKNIVTMEYANLILDHPKIKVMHPVDIATKILEEQIELFDFAASYSSIEHTGLGRYGDPLDPFGDLEVSAQTWCMLKPGGLFFLGLPVTKNGDTVIRWNALRHYNIQRLKHMAANWDVVEWMVSDVKHNNYIHDIFVMRKPTEYPWLTDN